MAAIEPQFAGEYEDRTTAAVKSVLIEIGQKLGSYEGKVAVIGGAVPWLLLPRAADMRHIGTGDVDLSLDAEALGDGEYAQLVALLCYRSKATIRGQMRAVFNSYGRSPLGTVGPTSMSSSTSLCHGRPRSSRMPFR